MVAEPDPSAGDGLDPSGFASARPVTVTVPVVVAVSCAVEVKGMVIVVPGPTITVLPSFPTAPLPLTMVTLPSVIVELTGTDPPEPLWRIWPVIVTSIV